MSGYSMRLGKVSTYATCSGLPHNYEWSQPFSVSFWFKLNNAININNLIIEFLSTIATSSPTTGWRICFYSSTGTGDQDGAMAMAIHSSSTNRCEAYFPYPQAFQARDGRWHHIVACWAGTGLASGYTYYIDGTAVTPGIFTNTLSGTTISTTNLRIGGGTYGTGGALDEIAIWDKVLSPAEVAWIWNSGDGANLLDGAAPSNLRSWWRMGEADSSNTVVTDSGPLAAHATMTANNIVWALGSRNGAAGYLEAVPSGGGAPAVTTTYQKRARDLGSGAVFLEWTSTDINSSPPTPPPVGPWGEIVVTAMWEQ